MLSQRRSFVCTLRDNEHFCCERCVHRAPSSAALRCAVHRACAVRPTGILWHAASAADLEQCPFGCWIEPGAQTTHVCPRITAGPVVDVLQCVGSFISNGRLYQTTNGGGLQVSMSWEVEGER